MHRWMSFSIVALLALTIGCESEPKPKPTGVQVETVVLRIPFRETYPDNEGAKRVVITQFRESRERSEIIGEAYREAGGPVTRRFVATGDQTWVMPKILGGYLKRVGFNVSFAEELKTFDRDVLRGVLKEFQADYLVSGRLERFDVRVLPGRKRPVIVSLNMRIDIYNKEGRLRNYYPAPLGNATNLGPAADDPAAIEALVNRTVHQLFERAFQSRFFVDAFDLTVEAAQELLRTNPPLAEEVPIKVETVEGEPEEPEKEEPKEEPEKEEPKEEPEKEPTAEEKAEAERLRRARELEKAVLGEEDKK